MFGHLKTMSLQIKLFSLLGCVIKLLASPTCPIQSRRSSTELTTGEISLAFGHAMEVRLSRRLRSGVSPFTPYKACLLLVLVGVFIALLARNCNSQDIIEFYKITIKLKET